MSQHSGHCRPCKERVRELLSGLFGQCLVSRDFPWSAKPEDYAGTATGGILQEIRAALSRLRGHSDFIKSPQVPPCDYYVPSQKLIIEFDESQHFTRPRLISLSLYPGNLELGFSPTRWMELCRKIAATDDIPFDRDERRAWYDALRDLLPALYGLKPTVRLYAEDVTWCSLDSASARDLETFRSILQGRDPKPT